MKWFVPCYNMGMGNEAKAVEGLDQIDIGRFFQILSGKLEATTMEVVAAAMAESVAEGDAGRVISCSPVDPVRLAQTRVRLRERQGKARRGLSCSSTPDGRGRA